MNCELRRLNAPYCSDYGFYGPGYFYGGVFLGMDPWAGWGYGHGWAAIASVKAAAEAIAAAAEPWPIAAVLRAAVGLSAAGHGLLLGPVVVVMLAAAVVVVVMPVAAGTGSRPL